MMLHIHCISIIAFEQCPAWQVNTWLANTDLDAIRRSFEEHGYAVVHNIIPKPQLRHYTGLYDSIQGGAVDASSHRHDLGGHKDQVVDGKENVGAPPLSLCILMARSARCLPRVVLLQVR